jgi:CheY-like chemotaxis protein
MAEERDRNVLVVGLDVPDFDRIAPFLTRKSFRVDRFPRTKSALDLITKVPFALLLVRFPPDEMEAQTFLDAARAKDSASRATPLLLVAAPADAARAELFVGRGANQVVRLDQPEADLQSAVSKLLGVAPRQSARLAVRLEVQIGDGKDVQLSQTLNVSSTGMLVETSRRPPRGERLNFEFMLGHRPVAGVAEVMRYATQERDGIQGLGLRFVSFTTDSRPRFEKHLEDIRAHPQKPPRPKHGR